MLVLAHVSPMKTTLEGIDQLLRRRATLPDSRPHRRVLLAGNQRLFFAIAPRAQQARADCRQKQTFSPRLRLFNSACNSLFQINIRIEQRSSRRANPPKRAISADAWRLPSWERPGRSLDVAAGFARIHDCETPNRSAISRLSSSVSHAASTSPRNSTRYGSIRFHLLEMHLQPTEDRVDYALDLSWNRSSRQKNTVPGDGARINQRPEVIEQRLRLGDFEGDTVLGPPGTGGLATLVDRRSRYTIVVKIQSKNADHVHEILKQRLKELDEERRRSITFDNGTEFARCHRLEKHLDIKLYFADPGCPYQRGTNENTNGLIRQYFPKGTGLSKTSPTPTCGGSRIDSTTDPAPASDSGLPQRFSSRNTHLPVAIEIGDRRMTFWHNTHSISSTWYQRRFTIIMNRRLTFGPRFMVSPMRRRFA